MAQPDNNPYAPSLTAIDLPLAHRTAVSRLRGPSMGILVTAAMGLIAGIDLTIMHVGFLSQDFREVEVQNELELSSNGPSAIACVAGLAISCVSLFHIYGALCMRRGRNYRIAVASASMSCIPFLAPMIWFGIPFGVWALVVFRRRDVRAAFANPLHGQPRQCVG
jgi:hypothetical protein